MKAEYGKGEMDIGKNNLHSPEIFDLIIKEHLSTEKNILHEH